MVTKARNINESKVISMSDLTSRLLLSTMNCPRIVHKWQAENGLSDCIGKMTQKWTLASGTPQIPSASNLLVLHTNRIISSPSGINRLSAIEAHCSEVNDSIDAIDAVAMGIAKLAAT